MSRLENLLTNGLSEGYAGTTERETIQRGSFMLEVSTFRSIGEDGLYQEYRDEWAAKRTGGGQELARAGAEGMTRLYAGGTIRREQLEELGLTKKDVIIYLKSKIKELGGQTRLYTDCEPMPDGDWQYLYRIINTLEDVPLTVAMETITFKERLVFAHGFMLALLE